MNVLLVNNLTKRLKELKKILAPHKITTVPFYKIPDSVSSYDAIVLSGGSKYRVKGNEDKYSKEIKIIKNCSLPTLGICLGFELICYAFGEELKKLKKKEKCIKEIKIIRRDKIFRGIRQLKVYESHSFFVERVRKLVLLAKSDAGVEVVRHPQKPLYGLQFHPEVRIGANNGFMVFENFLNQCHF